MAWQRVADSCSRSRQLMAMRSGWRLTEAEVTMLGELARHEGLNVSDWVRTTIRVEHARTFRPRGKKHGKRWG